jgi:outer membrane protein assembly factor BamB
MTATSFADPSRFVQLRSGSVAWRRVADDIVVLDTARSEYHAVNATGSVIWDRLVDGTTVATLAELLTAAFPAAADRAIDDVRAFLADLDASGLLEVAEPG